MTFGLVEHALVRATSRLVSTFGGGAAAGSGTCVGISADVARTSACST